LTPIRASGLLEANSWIELLRSYAVLDSVAVEQRLYVRAPADYEPAFTNFSLAPEFLPGSYELRVGAAGGT
jgi:hypothetical protein